MPADAAGGFLKGPPAPPRKANAAVDYLNTLYQPDDRLAIVAVGRHGPDPKVEQRVVTARAATRPGYQRFLRHLNATGHDIFVSMNPIRLKTQSREKADVLEVRRLQLHDGHRIRRKGEPDGALPSSSDHRGCATRGPPYLSRSIALREPPRIAPPSGPGTGGKVWPACSPSIHPRFEAPPRLRGAAAPGSAS